MINIQKIFKARASLILSSRSLSRVIGLSVIALIGTGFGLEEIGIIALFQAKLFFLATIIKFGFSQSAYQLAAQDSINASINLQIFHIWSIFCLLIFTIFMLILKHLQLANPSDLTLIFISALMISWISVESALRLPNHSPIKALAIEDIAPGLIFIMLISICILSKFEAKIVYLYFISLIPSMLFVIRSRITNIDYKKLDLTIDILPIIYKNISFFMISFSQVVNSHGAFLLLGLISGPTFSGAYRIALSIVSIYSIVSSSLATELQRVTSREKLAVLLKKKNKYALINLLVVSLLILALIGAYSFLNILSYQSFKNIIELSILLSVILFFKAFFGFPDSILVAKQEESYVSRIFILNAMIFFTIAAIYIFLGGQSPIILIFIIALIQPSAIIFYTKYLKKNYGISTFLNPLFLNKNTK